MYVNRNFRTKKALVAALAEGQELYVYSPGPFSGPTCGTTHVEGPWYPEPHKWGANVELSADGDGRIVKVLKN